MIIQFRQGIVKYPSAGTQSFLVYNAGTSTVDLIAANDPVVVSIAHGSSDYLITEPLDVLGAWSDIGVGARWLFWDINRKTGIRTFGSTQLDPIFAIAAPTSPSEDQHFFDLSTNKMFYFKNGMWREVIRVFAALYNGGFSPMGSGFPTLPYRGTQVGLSLPAATGRIAFDAMGKPLIRANGEFLSTESQFFVEGANINNVRLESNVNMVVANAPIPAYSVIRYTQNGIEVAEYDDAGASILAISPSVMAIGELDSVVIQGIIENDAWNFSTNDTLWVDNGALVTIDPNVSDPTTYPVARVPVARALSPTSIIFEQGLGGKGEKGEAGNVAGVVPATPFIQGIVRTSTNDNVVASNDDPRLSDARAPLPHTHGADEISVIPVGNITSTDVEAAINELDTNKLSLSGGTLTGDVELANDPTLALHPASKQYVDDLIMGVDWLEPIKYASLMGDNVLDPSTITPSHGESYIVAVGAVGDWAGEANKIATWNAKTTLWEFDTTPLFSQPIGTRFGVALTSSNASVGSFIGNEKLIAVLDDPTTPTWSFVPAVANEGTYVNGEESLHAYNIFIYNSTTTNWVNLGKDYSVDLANAIHVNVANEINQIANKATPVAADILVIEDSADSYNKKHIRMDAISANDTDAIHITGTNEVSLMPLYSTFGSQSDLLMLELASGAKASQTLFNFSRTQALALNVDTNPITPTHRIAVQSGAGGDLTMRDVSLLPSGGEVNTNTNTGTGAGLVLPKVGLDTPLKTVTSSNFIKITEAANEIDISLLSGGGATINGASHDGNSLSVNAQDVGAVGIVLSADGLNLFMIGVVTDTIYQYNLPTANSLAGATYSGNSLFVGTEDSNCQGITLSADGLKLFMVGNANDGIYEYNLSTANSLAGATYAGISLSIGTQEPFSQGVALSADGTKLWMVGTGSDTIYEYDLPTANTLTGATLSSDSLFIGTQETQAGGVAISNNGTKLWLVGFATNTIYEYDLPIANSLNGASYSNFSLDVSTESTNVNSITISTDDSKALIIDTDFNVVYGYDMAGIGFIDDTSSNTTNVLSSSEIDSRISSGGGGGGGVTTSTLDITTGASLIANLVAVTSFDRFLRKEGNIVTINIRLAATNAAQYTITDIIATLPVGFRPVANFTSQNIMVGAPVVGYFLIGSNGELSFAGDTGVGGDELDVLAGDWISFNGSWVVN